MAAVEQPVARLEFEAFNQSLRLPPSEIVRELTNIIGRKLTAYVGGVKDVRAVDRWIAGGELYNDAERRLRFAFVVVRTLQRKEDPAVIKSWLVGLNPELGDRSPLKLLKDGDLDIVAPEIMGAARSFLIGA